MKHNHFFLSLFLLCFLPGVTFAQKHVITRPTTKPTTELKGTPQAGQQSPKKTTAQRHGTKLSTAERQRVVDEIVANMVSVAGGTFMMGSTAHSDERPVHQVTVAAFSLGRYEVTQRQWRAVMGKNPSYYKGDNLPVENVTWDECQDFISRLNALTGRQFRLPTEAEWEFAARGGNQSRGYQYAGSDNPYTVAWYGDNCGGRPHPVGTKQPNELGLYDMSGNAQEWCQDWFGSYSAEAQTNPWGRPSGDFRVLRGGSWCDNAEHSRSTSRANLTPSYGNANIGLRLAL